MQPDIFCRVQLNSFNFVRVLYFGPALTRVDSSHQAPATLTFCKRSLPNGAFFRLIRQILVTIFPEYFYALFLTAIVEVHVYPLILRYRIDLDLGNRPFPSRRESLASLA